MKIPWNLVLPDHDLQQKLHTKLTVIQKPFIYTSLFVCSFIIVGLQINSQVHKRFKNLDQRQSDTLGSVILLLVIVAMILMLYKPRYTTKFVLISRLLICICICYLNYDRFHGKEVCNEPTVTQIKYFKTIHNVRQGIISFYIVMSIFLTPFCDHYFVTFFTSTLYFTLEFS